MENNQKICGIVCPKARKNIICELYELFGQTECRQFEIETQDSTGLNELLKSKDFDLLYVEMPYRLKVMPQLSKCTPEARLGGGVDIILKTENGKLLGHNTEVYGFSYLLDRAGIDVAGKSCVILGKSLTSVAVLAVLKERKAGRAVVVTRDKYEDMPDKTDIIIATPSAEEISLDRFNGLSAVVDLRYDQLNSKLLQDAVARSIPAIAGCAMVSAGVKLACELVSQSAISEAELSRASCDIRRIRTSVVIIGNDQAGKLELGNALSEKLGRRHYDLNKIIEQLNGKSIEQIIKQDGERELRRIEHVAAEWAGKQAGAVITTGEYIACREDNRGALKKNGVLVFLSGKEKNSLSETYSQWCDLELDGSDRLDENIGKLVNFIEA